MTWGSATSTSWGEVTQVSDSAETIVTDPPDEVAVALAAVDGRADIIEVSDVERAIRTAIKEPKSLSQGRRRGLWAERSAFGFSTHSATAGGPWGTYFQPIMSGQRQDGTWVHSPDLAEADGEIIDYWSRRARCAKHPVLVARYADLVWDATRFVTGGKRKPDVELAGLAIDSYVAAARLDDGTAWMDTHDNLGRALQVALSIGDEARVAAVVEVMIEYVDRTAEDDKTGTYCYLFDNLLRAKKGPSLSEPQERKIVGMFEQKFEEMTRPNGPWAVDPHSPRDVGLRLAAYYRRTGRNEDRQNVLRAIAEAFERRAKIGDALGGVFFLEEARQYYVEAGLREEAERVQRESQELAPEAEKKMVRHTVKFEISDDDREKFLASLMEGGLDNALLQLTVSFVPNQERLAKQIEELAKDHPLAAMIPPTLVGEKGMSARVDDTRGDPDGRMAFETARHIQMESIWISWALDHLIENGLTSDQIVDFVSESPLFTDDRLPLVRRGIEAHILGDYVQSIHVLVPQIERGLINLVFLLGRPSTKAARSGRAVTQFKSMNDALEDKAAAEVLGNLRMYLVATMAHPKGMNIRNDVCHGLWSADKFNKTSGERVLHVLLAVSLLRKRKDLPDGDPPQQEEPDGEDDDPAT